MIENIKGFTLVELIVTLSILAIISVMAVPSFTQAIRKSQLNTSGKELVNDITEIRSQAIMSKKDQVITFDTTKVGHWHPSKNANLISVSDTAEELKYSMSGLLKASNNVCLVLVHKKDSSFKAIVVARKNGLVIYDKSLSVCPSNLADG